ncbi:WD40 domain-containing protein [Limnoglobus roseus]|uniref:NB-ARC domain protein n=1 Tax=Limnoglobus roseus TaxID=2598579 RepID=A0A5C1AD61_9BACT|nr:c-type cytochrome domain-containing protein [Limnoglobus roseus]QEL16143.1 NB-ARC domain protein [Limnoglobus roseus]
MRSLALLFLLPAVAVGQEKKESKLTPIAPATLTRKEPIDYAKDVQPIFAAKCTVCHSGSEQKGKFDIGTFPALMKGGRRGVAIIAGKPAESPLYLYSSHNKAPVMPPKAEENDLTANEVAVLKLWIEQGAKGPAGPEIKARPTVVLTLPPALVKPVRAVAISPEKADKAVVAAGRGNQIHLFDGKTGAFKSTLIDPTLKTAAGKVANSAHISLVESLAYSPDGKTLASGSFQELTLWDAEKGTVRQRIGGFADRVVAIAYSPDGKLLATGGGAPTEDGEVKVFDAATGKLAFEVKSGHSDTVFGVCFSPDGKLLATGGADKFVKVWEVPGGKFVKSFEGHTHHVLDVGWTADGKKLVSAGADNILKVWDYEKGEKARDIPGHKLQVTRLAFVPKTQTFLSVSGDKTAVLWNGDNGGSMRSYAGSQDFLYAVATNPDGNLVATGGEEGIVRLYNGTNGQLVKAMLPPDAEPKKDEKK